ncbi:rab-GTPase-TBC domain-containing protein [Gorgonomyces haynaldii]|nr:rab-GTPase-TBC domain-containing protein [Gorgonomyces haynaldii]
MEDDESHVEKVPEVPEGLDVLARPVSMSSKLKDEYGFFITEPLDISKTDSKKILKREHEWLELVSHWDTTLARRKRNTIKKLCRLGIPDSLRAQVWPLLVDCTKKPNVYQELLQLEDHLPIFDVIERDINRCYPGHVQFCQPGQGQDNLRAILRAYARYNQTIGYCQGMGMLVGLLLMRMPAEDSFWMLVSIMNMIEGYHSENLYALRLDAYAFEESLRIHYRQLYRHMKELSPLTYLAQWFLTLYTMSLPWKTVLRVWDMFLWDGPKALFRAGLYILGSHQSAIRKLKSQGDMLQFLLQIPKEFKDPDKFINGCVKIKISHYELDVYRKRAQKLMEKEKNLRGM